MRSNWMAPVLPRKPIQLAAVPAGSGRVGGAALGVSAGFPAGLSAALSADFSGERPKARAIVPVIVPVIAPVMEKPPAVVGCEPAGRKKAAASKAGAASERVHSMAVAVVPLARASPARMR